MKKIIILILIIGWCQTAFSQSLIKFGLTYTIGKEQSHLGRKKDSNHEYNVNSSFGAGLSIELGYVYLGTRNYGPEATLSFFVGKSKTTHHIEEKELEKETIIKRKLLFFSPSLFIYDNSANDVNPYISSGLLFNVWENVTKTEKHIDKTNQQVKEKVWRVNYNKGIGYKSKLGVLHTVNDDFGVFAEMQFQMLSISYKNELLEIYTIDNSDAISTLTNSEKEKWYVPAFNHETNNKSSDHFNADKPESLLLKYANHNHFGLSGGGILLLK